MNTSDLFEQRVKVLGDWRGELLTKLRNIVLKASPGLTEEWKWDTLVWSHNVLVLTIIAMNSKYYRQLSKKYLAS